MEICGYTSIEFVIHEQFNDIDTAFEAQYNKVKLEDNKFRVNKRHWSTFRRIPLQVQCLHKNFYTRW